MSMGSEIRVSYEGLSTAAGNVSGAAQRMNSQLGDLKRFIAPMVATWEGMAAEDYQRKQAQWNTAAESLTAVLSQISVALGTANDSYRQVETSNAARWA